MAAVHAGSTNLLVATRNPSAKMPAAKASNSASNSLAAIVPDASLVPVSTFTVPRKATEGKDPFFPNSSRVYGVDTTAKAVGTPNITADLTLKGISGTPEQPLAIINTTTFTTGESNEVLIKNGRVKIQVVEINMSAGTVLLQIGAERRELRLAPLK